MPCVSVLFWLISMAKYVFKSPSIAFERQKNMTFTVNELVTYFVNFDARPGEIVEGKL